MTRRVDRMRGLASRIRRIAPAGLVDSTLRAARRNVVRRWPQRPTRLVGRRQSGFDGNEGGLGPIGDGELAQDVADMGPDRRFADAQ